MKPLLYIFMALRTLSVSYRHINFNSSFAEEIIKREERERRGEVITEIAPAPHTDWQPLGNQSLHLLEDDEDSSLENTICLCQMSSKLQSIAI